jgi:23S rRNA (cytosine1962-C5)-methyltransferase
VILDPPFFSTTSRGTVDLERHMVRLINKARPLVNNGGQIVAVNNAVFLSGQAFMDSLHALCNDGYVSIDSRIDIPEDCIGYPETITTPQLISPAPFNHSTKIAVLNIRHRT